jgi:hypothetical protein
MYFSEKIKLLRHHYLEHYYQNKNVLDLSSDVSDRWEVENGNVDNCIQELYDRNEYFIPAHNIGDITNFLMDESLSPDQPEEQLIYMPENQDTPFRLIFRV